MPQLRKQFFFKFTFQYGTRHIIDSLKRQGRPDFETLLICGGLSKNPFFIQTHAEACNLPVLCPNEKEMVLVGAAILGACAAKFYPDLEVRSNIEISFFLLNHCSILECITCYGWSRNRFST